MMGRLIAGLIALWAVVVAANPLVVRLLSNHPHSWNHWVIWFVVLIETLGAAYMAYRNADGGISAALLSGIITFAIAFVAFLYGAIRID